MRKTEKRSTQSNLQRTDERSLPVAQDAGKEAANPSAERGISEETENSPIVQAARKTESTPTVQGAAGEMESTATENNTEDYHDIYDRIAKRCLSISSSCTVSLINGLFGTDYPADSEVTYNWTENVDDGLGKTLADTIVTINGTHSYHCEFQMKKEGAIILRVFEYGFHHAMHSHMGLEVLDFPEPMVVYLYDEPMQDDYRLLIRFGTQGEFQYKVPVYPYLKRTAENPKERDQLIVLLPFQLLRLRRAIEKERTDENKEALKKIITHDIVEVLEQNVSAGNITPVEEREIVDLTQRLYDHIYGKYSQEMSGVNKVMSGALRLPGDVYVRQIRKLEEDIKEMAKENVVLKKRDIEQAGQLQERDNLLQEQAGQLQEQADQIAELKRQLGILQRKGTGR